MQTKWKAIGGLGLVLAACAAVYWCVPTKPAVSSEEVARRWNEVVGWSGVSGSVGQPVFGGALDGVRPSASPEVEAILDGWGERIPTAPATEVPAGLRAEIDTILAWGERPRFAGRCGDPGLSPIALFQRLRVALATATAADLERAQAVLRVAIALKERGSLLLTLIGASIARDVALWAQARGVPAWPALRAAGLDAQAYVRAMAREAVCSAEIVEGSAGQDGAVLLHLGQFKLDAHARLAPLQIPNPTFEALRPLVKAPPAADAPPIVAVLQVDQANMLEKFEAEARAFAEAIAGAR